MPSPPLPAVGHLPQASLLPLCGMFARPGGDGTTTDPESAPVLDVADAGAALSLAVSMAHDRGAAALARQCLTIVVASHAGDGSFTAPRGSVLAPDEAAGWAIRGLGTATQAPWADVRHRARRTLVAAAGFTTRHPAGGALAALGALASSSSPDPVEGSAVMAARLVESLVEGLGRVDGPDRAAWPWPEARLWPGSAVIAEALLEAAAARCDGEATGAPAVAALRWLVARESVPGHLSPTPIGGRGPGDPVPGFDQVPGAAAALAAAAGSALRLTRDRSWERPVMLAAGWFAGANDLGVPMFDRDTGRAFDALRRDGVHRTQSARSTIAFVAVLRELQRLRVVRPRPSRDPCPPSGLVPRTTSVPA